MKETRVQRHIRLLNQARQVFEDCGGWDEWIKAIDKEIHRYTMRAGYSMKPETMERMNRAYSECSKLLRYTQGKYNN